MSLSRERRITYQTSRLEDLLVRGLDGFALGVVLGTLRPGDKATTFVDREKLVGDEVVVAVENEEESHHRGRHELETITGGDVGPKLSVLERSYSGDLFVVVAVQRAQVEVT